MALLATVEIPSSATMLHCYSSSQQREIQSKTDSYSLNSKQNNNNSLLYTQHEDFDSDESYNITPSSYPETSCSSSSYTGYLQHDKEMHVLSRIEDDSDDWADFGGRMELTNCYPLDMMNCEEQQTRTTKNMLPTTMKEQQEPTILGLAESNELLTGKMSFFEAMMQYEPCLGGETFSVTMSANDDSHDDDDYDHYVYGYKSAGDEQLEPIMDHSSAFTSLYGNDGHDNMMERLPLQTKWARYFFTDRHGHVSIQDDSRDLGIDTFNIESAISFSSLSSLGENESLYNEERDLKRHANGNRKEETCKGKCRRDGTTLKKRFGCLNRLLKPCKTL